MLDPHRVGVDWTGSGVHSVRAECRVNAVVQGGTIAIRHVHGHSVDIFLFSGDKPFSAIIVPHRSAAVIGSKNSTVPIFSPNRGGVSGH